MSSALAPWSIARRTGGLRRALLLLMLGALLYGLGVQAARACLPVALATHMHVVGDGSAEPAPCHDDAGITQAVCESHCRADAQNSRVTLNFDLPAAVPVQAETAVAPLIAVAVSEGDPSLPSRDGGPPLHVLFSRYLR
jgi:hypothetical protein